MPLGVVAMFGEAVLKGTVLLVVAFALARALLNAPAAARHLVWSVALVGLLVIPALSGVIPWKLEVLPAIQSAAVVEVLSSDRVIDPIRAEALGGGARRAGAPVAGPARTDQGRIPLSGSLETDGATRVTGAATTTGSWQLPTARQLLSWVPLIWLLGVGVLSLRILISLGAIRWMVWRGASADPEDWDGELDAARSVLGLTGSVRLVVSRLASIPFTTGILRPVIVLPPSSATWDRGRRRAVLLHELSHLRRGDVLSHFVSQVACALYWFHPLAWVAAKRLRVECERACDDLVLNSGERPTDYAEHLLSIVREAARRRMPALALPMARHAGLEERVSAILEFDGRLRSLSRSSAGMIVALLVLTVVPLAALAPTAPDGRRGVLDADTVADIPVSVGEAQVRQVRQPNVLCSDEPDDAIATFEDSNLEAAIRAALSLGAQDDLTCRLVSELTDLTADSAGIESLDGIQNLTSLERLHLRYNTFTDISALSGLTSLTSLSLGPNDAITDISPLSGLTGLEYLSLRLEGSSITDISALSGLTSLEILRLNSSSITDISALSGLTSLRELNLTGTSVSDIGVLGGLTSLEILRLNSTRSLTSAR